MITDRYKRWRHTKGYGVHSPYAYEMVKSVVNPGNLYGYYGYIDIEAAAASSGLSRKMATGAEMFLRLIDFLRPDSLFLPLGINAAYHAAAFAADSKMKIVRKPIKAAECQMISTHDDFISLDILKKHLQTPGNSIAFLGLPVGWREQLFEALPEGLMLYSPTNAIIVSRANMQKVAYDMHI